MEYMYATPEAHIGLKAINFSNIRNLMLKACLEAVTEGRHFTYTDLFMDVLPRDDEH